MIGAQSGILSTLLLTGVRASAAQNAPVNTICPQCGSVLASGERVCSFCDSVEARPLPDRAPSTQGNLALHAEIRKEWRGELNQRLQAYRARRRKASSSETQSALPFDDIEAVCPQEVALEVDQSVAEGMAPTDDFAFTIAIGRIAQRTDDQQMVIDVSTPPEAETTPPALASGPPVVHNGLFPMAPLDERRRALKIDAACLAFAYGGFLALFGSLGGHFTLSKLSGAVCFFCFAFVYLQYFGLFTIFGGSTPGMMVSGLQVASFTGDVPSPRQYLLRAVGYMLSAGTFFLGFLWAAWDEDGLTWHDRLSHTYLTNAEIFGDEEISHPAAAR